MMKCARADCPDGSAGSDSSCRIRDSAASRFLTRAPAPNVSIDLGDTTELDIRVSVAPYFSILAMLSDAVAGMRRGLPAPLRRNIWDSLRGSNRTRVAPVGTPGQSILPDCVV